ncbi:hypothetical protein [Microviridae sp.]|nr:hypothetical protein [Microviridae sp.]
MLKTAMEQETGEEFDSFEEEDFEEEDPDIRPITHCEVVAMDDHEFQEYAIEEGLIAEAPQESPSAEQDPSQETIQSEPVASPANVPENPSSTLT